MNKIILKKASKNLSFAKEREQEKSRILSNPRTVPDQMKRLSNLFFCFLQKITKENWGEGKETAFK